jgi:adenylylsulfate reductase subunit B
MSMLIDATRCNGCGRCVAVCPGALLQLGRDGRAVSRHPEECWSCAACVKACARQAAALYRAPELGGNGALLRAAREGTLLRWSVTLPGGAVYTIIADRGVAERR